jgi:hypothetical protein
MQQADSNKLKAAILAGKPDDVETEINKVCASLSNSSSNSDYALTELSNAILVQCKLNASVLCYNCISTLPAQSELKIAVSYQGIQKVKIIDISRSGNRLVFAGMHD